MRNKDKWTPGKFVYKKEKLIASRDERKVGVGSRLILDITASLYDFYIPKYVGGKLVDLGCGEVPLFEAYKDYATDNICVDWAGSLHKSEYQDCQCDLSQKLPFRDEEFDTIILSDVFEHIPTPETLWRELFRIAAPNGKVLLNVPFLYWLHETPHDYYRYSEHALRRFAELTGFEILLLKPIGGAPEVMANTPAKNLQFVTVTGRSLAKAVQSFARLFIRTALGRKLSDKTGKFFPLGYFMTAEKRLTKTR